jgi:GTP pyrophosphokinase
MIEVRALDRDHLLADVVYVISDHHLSISTAHTFTGDDQVSVLQFEVEVGDPTLLEQLLAAVRNVDGVFDSRRVVPSSVRPPS